MLASADRGSDHGIARPPKPIGWLRASFWVGITMVIFTACSSAPTPRIDGSAAGCPELTLSSITAPVDGRGSRELDRLQRNCSSTAARLREAFVRGSTGDEAGALQILNRIVFGQAPESAMVEAFARYLRADIFARRGEVERAKHERSLAASLTIDRELKASLARRFAPAAPPKAPARPARLAVLTRSDWSAQRARASRMSPMRGVSRITVHHSANLTRSTGRRSAATAISSIQRFHIGQNGWGDIGYHFLIDPAGRVWRGRDLSWQGAHAGDNEKNRNNIGVCLLGNFVPNAQGRPPQGQLQALEDLVAALCNRYRIPASAILTHRELKATSCPGPYLQAATKRIRAERRGFAVPPGSD